MLPHSYTADSLSKSQDLAAKILSASTPQQIVAACSGVEAFLHSHSSDHSRHFFSIAFPTLILKLFGFANDSGTTLSQSNGWIDVINSCNDPDLASRVFQLLSPSSILFNSIYAVDHKSLVKFVFPTERLPEWARFMLSTEKDLKILSNLCPMFKGKVKEDSFKGPGSMYQIQLNVFEYYMFWFAYYPVCRGNNENSTDNVLVKRSKKEKSRLEHWTYSLPGFSSNVKRGGTTQKVEFNLYLRLLYAYMREFVPVRDLILHQQPYRSSLLNYTGGSDGSVILRAEFLINTLINYWLIDNDFLPLSINDCKWFGVSYPFCSVLGKIPPTSGLGELIKLLVKYLNLSSNAITHDCESNIELGGSLGQRVSDPRSVFFDSGVKTPDITSIPGVCAVGSWNAWVQRPLYRFILRTFLFCPVGTSLKNVSEVFSVWTCYMEPWFIDLDDFVELEAEVSGSNTNVKKVDSQPQACGYSSSWQGYVLSNYLYYSSLVMHFIGFAHKFLHTDPEVIVKMVLKVVNVLTSSKELAKLIKNVDTVYHSEQNGYSRSKLNCFYRFVPAIREQLQDWEKGLCETDADGSFLHENWNKDLRLFSDGEDGGQQLFQLFILRAEVELQSIATDNLSDSLQCIDTLKSRVNCFFGGITIKPISFSLDSEQEKKQSRDELFKPKRAGNLTLADIKYKGDWMKRPISDDEVAWLAKLLIWLSDFVNESLGLHHPEISFMSPKWSYVEVPSDMVGNVNGPVETVKAVLYSIGSWFLMLMGSVLKLMRKRGMRLNLRILASKKIITVLFMLAVFSVLKKAFALLHRA